MFVGVTTIQRYRHRCCQSSVLACAIVSAAQTIVSTAHTVVSVAQTTVTLGAIHPCRSVLAHSSSCCSNTVCCKSKQYKNQNRNLQQATYFRFITDKTPACLNSPMVIVKNCILVLTGHNTVKSQVRCHYIVK